MSSSSPVQVTLVSVDERSSARWAQRINLAFFFELAPVAVHGSNNPGAAAA